MAPDPDPGNHSIVNWLLGRYQTQPTRTVDADGTVLTADEIYWRIRGGPGADRLGHAVDASRQLMQRYKQRQEQIGELIATMTAAWTGAAANGAGLALQPLIRVYQEACLKLGQAKAGLDGQVAAFTSAYNAVQYVSATPPSSGLINDLNPFITDTDRAISAYNDKASSNIAVYQQYAAQSRVNAAQMPTPYPTLASVTVPPMVIDSRTSGYTGTTSARNAASEPDTPQQVSGAAAPLSSGSAGRYTLPNDVPGTSASGGSTPVTAPSRPSQPGGRPPDQPDGVAPGGLTDAQGSGYRQLADRDTRQVLGGTAGGAAVSGRGQGNQGLDHQVGRGIGYLGRQPVGDGVSTMESRVGARVDVALSGQEPMVPMLGGGASRASDAEDIDRISKYVRGPDPDEFFAGGGQAWPPVMGIEED